MNKLGAAVFIGQSLDAGTFAVAVTLYPVLATQEQNPVVVTLYAAGGVALVLAVKVGLGAFVAAFGRPKGWWRYAYIIAAVGGLVGAAANVYAFAQLAAL